VRFLQFIATTLLTQVCAVAPGYAEKRVALVIGNGAYRHAEKLANPVNDVRGIRHALASLGFDVIFGEDLDQKDADRGAARVQGTKVVSPRSRQWNFTSAFPTSWTRYPTKSE
jgi:hypothetical protein